MEPPLKSRFRRLGHLLALARSGGSLFAPRCCAPLIEHCRAKPNGDMPSGGAPIRFRADRENGSRLRHVVSGAFAGSDLRQTATLALALVGAARHRFGRRFSYRVRVWTFSAIRG